jgi:hypothetical protein
MSLVTFRDLIAENQRKSVWLVVSFCIVTSLALTGLVLGIVSLMVPELLEAWFWPATVMTFIGGAYYCWISGFIRSTTWG